MCNFYLGRGMFKVSKFFPVMGQSKQPTANKNKNKMITTT
jgi:hypothetical protein